MGFTPEGGSLNFNLSTKESHSNLHEYLRISRGAKKKTDGFFLRAESFYNLASNIDELDSEGGISLHEQSHGGSFMSLVENLFSGNGLYILDEPESALSPMILMTLMCHLKKLVDQNSQFIISTHPPILLTFPEAKVTGLEHNCSVTGLSGFF